MTTQTHDSIRESRVIGAEPEHDPTREANATQAIYANDGQGAIKKRNGRREGCGKDAPWKSRKADFSTSLGNPANNAGFPLFPQPRLLLDIPCLVDLLAPTQIDENGSVYHRR